MAEVRSKMSDVKCQLEARGAGDAGRALGATVEQGPPADPEPGTRRKPADLELLGKGAASRHCRSALFLEICSPEGRRPTPEAGGDGGRGATGGLPLRRPADPVEKELRGLGADAAADAAGCPRDPPPCMEVVLKPRSAHCSPPSLGGPGAADKPSSSKQEEPLYGASGSDLFTITGLNGIVPLAKTRRAPAMGAGLLTDSSLDCDPEGASELRESLLALSDGTSSRPDEGLLSQKQVLHLLPGMSSDSELECDTENEDEAVALEAGDCRYDTRALPCPGDQLSSDDLSFTAGESTER
ncbi:hypothetical protein ANANG_G00162790 [Anguilla anguilla]|uniref:Uncharacterized protein n=1 Tax=Anguilla anguilla TaxID=7936 RepID=A0A9D3MEQ8_ANGAN|nr:hypothetical protein ANANG_G00162790 [Anguilla anguilla]